MASITSNAVTGNSNAVGSWAGGVVPGDGDTVILADNAVITLPTGVTWTIGDAANPGTPAIQTKVGGNGTGRLIVDVGATLIYKGMIIQGNANWVVNAGANVFNNHATTSLEWRIGDGTTTNAILTLNGGTGVNRITVQSTGAAKGRFTGPTNNNAGKIQATGVQFTDIGSATLAFLKADNFTAAYAAWFDDCLFTNCGKFDFSNNYLTAGATFRLRRTTIRATADAGGLALYLLVGNGTHTGLVFDRVRSEGQFFVVGQSATAIGVSWSDVLLQGSTTVHPLDCSSTPPGGTADLVLLHNKVAASGAPSRLVNGTVTRLMSNRQGMAVDGNGHATTIDLKIATTIVGAIMEFGVMDEGGDQIQLTNSPATNIPLLISGVLLLAQGVKAAGTLFNVSAAGVQNARITVERCTAFVSGAMGAGAVITENTSGAAGMFQAIRDMLWWGSGTGVGVFQVNGTLADGSFNGTDYNNRFNIAADAYQPADAAFAAPTPPGPHDLQVDPQFVDVTRNLLTWGQSLNAALTTRQQVVDELMKRNDDAGWAAGFTLDAYYDWVRAGFVPQNMALATAGHDGSYIGALAPQAAPTPDPIPVVSHAAAPRYDASRNQMIGTGDPGDVQAVRVRVTVAQINAGVDLLAAVGEYAYRLIDVTLIAIGGAASGATDVRILGTRGGLAVALMTAGVSALTRSALVKPGTAGVTVPSNGGTYVPLDPGTPITLGKTGGTLAGATHVDVIAKYVLEG